MDFIFQFGKYRGYSISKVPEDYLNWLIDKAKKDLKTYEGELERRILILEADATIEDQIIESGFRILAKKFHPDVGGDPVKMRELIATREKMKSRK